MDKLDVLMSRLQKVLTPEEMEILKKQAEVIKKSREDYEERKVARYDGIYNGKPFYISTAYVHDNPEHPYETAISHPRYNKRNLVIVQEYSSREEAEEGHKKWESLIVNGPLPDVLIDKSTNGLCKTIDSILINRGEEGLKERFDIE